LSEHDRSASAESAGAPAGSPNGGTAAGLERELDALRESEARFRALFENAPEAVCIVDADLGRFVDVNANACRMFGTSRESLLSAGPAGMSPPSQPDGRDSARAAREFIERALAGEALRFEWTHRDAAGRDLPCEVHLVRLPSGARRLVRGSIVDIGERARAELLLRQSEERMELALHGADLGTWDWNVKTGEVVFNERWAEMLGYTLDEIEPHVRTWEVLVHPDDMPNVKRVLEDHLAGRTPSYETEHRVRHKSGQWIWILDRGRVIERDPSGAPLRACGTHLDITERLRADAELKEAQIIGQYGSWTWDLASNRVDWSDNLCRIHGLEPGTPITFEKVMSLIHPDDRPDVRRKIEEMLAEKAPREFEYRIVAASGAEKWMRGMQRFVFDAEGNILRLIGSVQDITARKHAEDERRRLQSQIQHAQKLESLGILAGGIAHDFNNLLTSILGYSDLVRLAIPPDSPARDYIDEVVKGARRAADLTQQMLAYSGKGRFVVQPLDLSAVVEDMARLLEISISKRCAMRFDLRTGLPAFEGDAAQIRQVVMNLVINASDSIGDRSGVIAVGTGLKHCDRADLTQAYPDASLPEGPYVYLEVADSGCGMSEETLAKIFEPFFTTKFTGRGLGLAAVLGIVRGHRGAIRVRSDPGKGSTFRVMFPVSGVEAIAESPAAGGASSWRGSGTVLVVDDEESVRGIARRMLERMGFDVLTAVDGREALEVFERERERVRLVLLDMTMPRLDGEETFREMRRIRDGVRTILSSGYNEQTATDRFAGEGLAGFIQKPYRYAELQAVIRRALEA
jgi:two-component system cell cycle sensor histidine kinase/response regulator CckA